MKTTSTRRAITALLLLAPVPTLGVLSAMVLAPGPLGRVLFLTAKVWLVGFPLVWWWLVEQREPSTGLAAPRGVVAGLLAGALMSVAMVSVGILVLPHIDPAPLQQRAREMGLGTPLGFAAGALGWTLVNSLVEELVYRWFILRQCRALLRPVPAALLQAAIFTAHHALALATYLAPAWTAVASAGVLLAGLVWAFLMLHHRSIWSPWLSHIVADAAVFALGWRLLFS